MIYVSVLQKETRNNSKKKKKKMKRRDINFLKTGKINQRQIKKRLPLKDWIGTE